MFESANCCTGSIVASAMAGGSLVGILSSSFDGMAAGMLAGIAGGTAGSIVGGTIAKVIAAVSGGAISKTGLMVLQLRHIPAFSVLFLSVNSCRWWRE